MEAKNMKVAIVGHSGVGKTSIINRYLFGSFDCNL
jgi:GTPase SAR1 family protein